MSDWLDQLNAPQRQAVTHTAGPLLVVAGAGTGKTLTLASRVAHLLQRGVSPEAILLLTFTRRAAAEMVRRATHITGDDATRRVWGGTFHATANRLLRIYGTALNLPPEFTVIDEGDAADLMNLLRNELGYGSSGRRFPRKRTLVSIYSRTVNAGEKLSDTLESRFPWCREDIDGIAQIFDQYVERKRGHNLLDYDDLLLFWKALCDVPGVGERLAGRFEHILVDEYQDTNSVQADILLGMRRGHPNIMVVGDDAQSIYSFRAATIRNILDFPKLFPGCTVIKLEQNYRSVQPILDASNAVMASAGERFTKELWSTRSSARRPVLIHCADEADQVAACCTHILRHFEEGTPLMRQAVLFRAGHHSDALEVELTRRNIPFHKYGGLKFMETAHIKDLLALLRLLENADDELSWFRILVLLEGIGPRSARRIMDELGVGRRMSEGAAAAGAAGMPLRRLIEGPPPVPPAARERFAELRQALADVLSRSGGGGAADADSAEARSLPAQIEILRRFYEPVLERVYDNPAPRVRDLDQLQQIAAGYRSRRRFITDLTLDPPAATSDLAQPPHLDDDYLILSTMHSAKGCEWDVVHILHAADGMMPSDMAVGDAAGIEEERRLLYVAMTRARDVLYVYFPLRYYHRRHALGDGHSYAQLTRFFDDGVRALLEQRRVDDAAVGDDPVVESNAAQRTDDYLRQLWRQ